MKRFVYAAGAVILTSLLVLLAMAVAQRDARVSDAATDESNLPYANQPAEPISIDSDLVNANSTNAWPPAPIVRANDANFPEQPQIDMATPVLPPTRATLTSFAGNESLPAGSPSNSLRKDTDAASSSEPPPLSDLPPFPAALSNSNSSSLPALPNSMPGSLSTAPPLMGINALPGPSLPNSSNYMPEPASSPLVAPPMLNPPSPPSLSRQAMPSKADADPQISEPTIPAYNPSSSSLQSSSEIASPPIATFGAPTVTPPSYLPSVTASPSATPSNPPSPRLSTAFSSTAPGARQFDGSQNPSMEIQKRAPSEVQVGVPATFTLLVRNVGNATAFDVNVVDSVPKGAKLVRTSPQAQLSGENGIAWKLGEMAAASEQVLTIEIIPETEGEIGSVASVNFAAQASVRTMSTQPKLVVKQLFEPVVLGGENILIMIEVSNAGTGTARDVRLQEDVPGSLRHATGSQVLERTLGDLAPGDSVKMDIELTAITAGKVANLIRAVSENAATTESSAQIEVVSPKLEIAMEGASLRYLERQVTYRIGVSNTGTAIATNVEMVLYLPSGLQFNSTINQGTYIPNQHAVRWELAELAAGSNATTEVTLLPVEEGSFVLRMQSSADGTRSQPIEKPVRVEGQSELAFTIEDDNDPIETDGKTTYVVKIINIGTRIDSNVELVLDLPDGSVVEQVDAPVDYKVSPRNVVFAPIAQLRAKDQQTIRLSVRHTREGIHNVRAQLKSKLRPTPVSKEESTEVYRDR